MMFLSNILEQHTLYSQLLTAGVAKFCLKVTEYNELNINIKFSGPEVTNWQNVPMEIFKIAS